METGSVGVTSRLMEVRDTFQYVLLLDRLISLLNNEKILDEVSILFDYN